MGEPRSPAVEPHGHDPQRPDPKRWWWALRIVAMVLSGVIGLAYLLLWVLLLSSVVGSNSDPHGYTMIFSVLFMVPVGAVFCLVFPFCWPSGRRLRAALFTLVGFLVAVVIAFAVLSWAD